MPDDGRCTMYSPQPCRRSPWLSMYRRGASTPRNGEWRLSCSPSTRFERDAGHPPRRRVLARRRGRSMADEAGASPDAATVAWLAEKGLRLERGQDLEENDVWFLATPRGASGRGFPDGRAGRRGGRNGRRVARRRSALPGRRPRPACRRVNRGVTEDVPTGCGGGGGSAARWRQAELVAGRRFLRLRGRRLLPALGRLQLPPARNRRSAVGLTWILCVSRNSWICSTVTPRAYAALICGARISTASSSVIFGGSRAASPPPWRESREGSSRAWACATSSCPSAGLAPLSRRHLSASIRGTPPEARRAGRIRSPCPPFAGSPGTC